MRSELSKKSKYRLPKERYLELKHFCLQYPDWIQRMSELLYSPVRNHATLSGVHQAKAFDGSEEYVLLSEKANVVSDTALYLDRYIGPFILEAVTKGRSYDTLQARQSGIPCCRNTFYELYRKFFWLLDRKLRHEVVKEE